MSVGRHPDKWWDWCMSEDEKKEIDPMFIEGLHGGTETFSVIF